MRYFIFLYLACTNLYAQHQSPHQSIVDNPTVELQKLHAMHSEQSLANSRKGYSYELNVYSYKSNPEMRVLKESYFVIVSKDTVVARSETTVYVSTPNRAFVLYRKNKSSAYGIAFLTPVSAQARTSAEILESESRVEGTGKVGFRVFDTEQLSSTLPNCHMPPSSQVSKSLVMDDRILQLAYSISLDNDHVKNISIKCNIDRNFDYRVVSAENETVYKSKKVGVKELVLSKKVAYSYNGDRDHLPILIKSVTIQDKYSDEPNRIVNTILDYNNYTICDMSPEILTLEHYGLVDPIEKPVVWWPYALVALGLLGIGVYLFLRRRAKAKAV